MKRRTSTNSASSYGQGRKDITDASCNAAEAEATPQAPCFAPPPRGGDAKPQAAKAFPEPSEPERPQGLPTGHPFTMTAAGTPSNRVPQAGPIRQVAPPGTPVAPQVDTKRNVSAGATAAIHAQGNEESAATEERLYLDKKIGRKARAVDPESLRNDPTVAGNFNKKDAVVEGLVKGKVRNESEQPEGQDPNEVAYIIGNKVTENKPLEFVNFSRKGRGEIRAPTEFSEKMALRENQSAFRFEVCAGKDDFNGGVAGRKAQVSRNPITHVGVDGEGEIDMGSRKQRRPSTAGSQADSDSYMNFDRADREAAAVRDARLRKEPGFAALCEQTAQQKQTRCEVGELKQKNHHSRSARVADCLTWNA